MSGHKKKWNYYSEHVIFSEFKYYLLIPSYISGTLEEIVIHGIVAMKTPQLQYRHNINFYA